MPESETLEHRPALTNQIRKIKFPAPILSAQSESIYVLADDFGRQQVIAFPAL
jgi:hypothetical protein